MRSRSVFAFAPLFVVLAGRPAGGEDLAAFLSAASTAARPQHAVRGDGELVTASPDGTARDRLAIVRRPNGDVYLELKNAGVRALLRADGRASLIPAPGARATPFAPDAAFAGSEFTREDLQPFATARYRSPTIVDRNSSELVVSLTPLSAETSQYVLQVITFDSDKKVPVKVMSYKDAISNLVKMLRDRELTEAAGTWLPGEVVLENFALRSTSTMTLRWKPIDDLPALSDPAALDQPSPLAWP